MHYLILTTTPSKKVAQKIADRLILKSKAACINIIKGVESIYKWQGKIERSSECLLMIKTNKKNLKKAFDLITQIHPYEVPEIIALKIDQGSQRYLNWIDTCLE